MIIKNQKGVVLVVVLAFMLLLALAITSIVFIGISEIQAARALANSTRAFYLAEAGLQRAIYSLKNSESYRTSPTTISDSLGDGSFSVSPQAVSGEYLTYILTSTGTVNGFSRRIEQTVEVVVGLKDFVLFFGGSGSIAKETIITGNVFSQSDLAIDQDSVIHGSVIAAGNITLGINTVVEGSVIAGGTVTKGTGVQVLGEEITLSTMPGEVTLPSLATTYYDGEIASASGKEAGNKDISGTLSEHESYENGFIYVNGQADVTGSITGPGTIVATGKIVVGQSVGIGDDIRLIAGGNLEANKEHTIGSSCTLYSSSLISLAKEGVGTFGTVGTGSAIITPGIIEIAKENVVYGLVYGATSVSLAKEVAITGTAGSGGGLSDIAKEGTYDYNLDFINYGNINGLTGYGTTVKTSKWQET